MPITCIRLANDKYSAEGTVTLLTRHPAFNIVRPRPP